MRFPSIIFFLFLFGITSCKPNDHSIDSNTTLPTDSVVVNTDSLRLDSIRWVRDCFIKDRFEVKRQDWNSWQYYHAYYHGYAGQRYNTLTCLVSAYGTMVITSSLEAKHCGQKHNRIEVLIGDSVYGTEPSTWHDVAVESGMGSTECTMFEGKQATTIAESIAAHAKEVVKVKIYRDEKLIATYELDDRSRRAFADCVPLNNLMKQMDVYDHTDEWVDEL